MSSLLTNTSAMVALTTLRGINNDMATTQNRISTGLRVADASDNAAYWSIATSMKSDNSSLSAVQDSLGLGAATVDVAFTAMDKAVDVVTRIKDLLTTATQGTADKTKIQADITELQKQLKTIASSASFSGENWLEQDKATASLSKEIAGGFTRDSSGAAKIQNITVDTDTVVLVDTRATVADNSGILSSNQTGDAVSVTVGTTGDISSLEVVAAGGNEGFLAGATRAFLEDHFSKLSAADKGAFDGTAATAALAVVVDGTNTWADVIASSLANVSGNSVLDIDISKLGGKSEDTFVVTSLINMVDRQFAAMTDAATDLGSAKARIDMQMEFSKNLSDAIDRGVGQLVDADMNAESTRLKALQTQQQLGIQALSIANTGSQNILSLFR